LVGIAREATPTGAIATRTIPVRGMLPAFHVLIGADIWHPANTTIVIECINKIFANAENLTDFILVPAA
jgi:hypothetical protein